MTTDIYDKLKAPFDVTHKDVRGGVELTYITGEQVSTRLNEVLGVAGWTFRVLEHGINPEADEVWSLGEIVARIKDEDEFISIVKQQFGSQKIRRSRSTGAPLDLGFDMKGATTDAMKKCATLLGVGLYLSHKESQAQQRGGQQRQQTQQRAAQAKTEQAATTTQAPVEIHCSQCNSKLEDFVNERDQQKWTAQKLAEYGRSSKHKRVLCLTCLGKANEAKTA